MPRCSFAFSSPSCIIASTLNRILAVPCARKTQSCFRGFTVTLALLAAVLFSSTPARSQTAHLAGIALGGNLATPIHNAPSFATDSSGNIYVADTPNLRIVIIPPGDLTCASACTIVALTNLVAGEHPTRLTVDSAGNMYVATQDTGSDFGHIYYLAKSSPGNYTQSVFYSTCSNIAPWGVTLDGKGNLFVAESGPAYAYGDLLEMSATPIAGGNTCNGGVFTRPISNVAFLDAAADRYGRLFLSTGSNNGWAGVYTDGQGNNWGAWTVYRYVPYTPCTPPTDNEDTNFCSQIYPVSQIYWPMGVAVDPLGNVYATNNAPGSTFWKIPYNYPAGYVHTIPYLTGLDYPYGVALAPDGNIIVNGADGPVKFGYPVEFGTQAANSGSSTILPLRFQFDSGGKLNPATSAQALTMGALWLDFNYMGLDHPLSDACMAGGSYNAGDRCTVKINFNPRAPGSRSGAVELLRADLTPIAAGAVHGTALGPQMAFSPVAAANISALPNGVGYVTPGRIALDGAGNLYVVDTGSTQPLWMIPAKNPNCSTDPSLLQCARIDTGINQGLPYGLALDGAGNVYIADALSSGSIIRVPANNLSCNGVPACTTIGGSLDMTGIMVLTVSPGGDVYFSTNLGKVWKIPATDLNCTQSGDCIQLGGGAGGDSVSLSNLVLDAAGNLYVLDTQYYKIYKIPPTDPACAVAADCPVLTNPAGMVFPGAIATDGSGNLYILGNPYSNRDITEVVRVPFSDLGCNTPGDCVVVAQVPYFQYWQAIAADPAGNVYVNYPVSSTGNKLGLELIPSGSPSAVTFPDTTVGQTSAVQSEVVSNIGNTALNIASAVPSTGFQLDYPSTACYNGTTGASVAAGGSCTLEIVFTPTTATLDNGSLVLTDNWLNLPGRTQTVGLQGKGRMGTPSVTAWPTASAITYGQTLSASTLTGGAASVPGSFAWTKSKIVPGIGVSSQSVTFTPADSADYSTATGKVNVTVNKATPSVTAWPTASAITYGQTLATSKLTGGTASVAGSFAWTNPKIAPGAGAPSESVTFTPTDSTNYGPATGSVKVAVSKAPQAITFTAPTSPVTYGVTPIALKATGGKSGNPVVFSIVSGPGKVSGAALTVNGTGTIVVAANQAGNSNYFAASQVTHSIVVNKATLTVTANNHTMAYGAAVPALTYTVTGYVNGDPAGKAYTGTPLLTTTATRTSAPGTYPITVAIGTLKSSNYTFTLKNGTMTVTPLGTVATPKIAPATGTYTGKQTVTITDASNWASIYYTLDGSAPTTKSTPYVKAFSVAKTTTVKAIATKAGYTGSAVQTSVITIH